MRCNNVVAGADARRALPDSQHRQAVAAGLDCRQAQPGPIV